MDSTDVVCGSKFYDLFAFDFVLLLLQIQYQDPKISDHTDNNSGSSLSVWIYLSFYIHYQELPLVAHLSSQDLSYARRPKPAEAYRICAVSTLRLWIRAVNTTESL